MEIKGYFSNIHLAFQIFLLILIIAIPMHFYINSELENIKFKDEKELQKYAQKVANKIYLFSNSKQKEFYFPRSNIFKSAIYNAYDKPIFSLLDSNITNAKESLSVKNLKEYIKYPLKKNIFNANYLVVSKDINYNPLIINVIVMLMVITFLVLLSIFSIIQQSAKPYKKLNIYLENFIKDAMHEMKTPIGVILLNLDGLNEKYEHNKMLKRAKSALKNMMVVYEDLEFFVKNKEIKHPKESINISNFVKDRVEFFWDLLQEKEIKVKQNIEENLVINFNKMELSRVIDNTLSNAIKYSKNKTTIELNLYNSGKNIILSIKDEGRGIKDIKKIFNRYYRGDRVSGGFGIGLNIVKQICDRNNVKISVKSKESEGAEFIYIF